MQNMDFKKTIIILLSIIALGIIIVISTNYFKQRGDASSIKKDIELGLQYIKQLDINNNEVKKIEALKNDADALYEKSKNKDAYNKYLEIANKAGEELKKEAENIFNQLNEFGNSTKEEKAILEEANNKLENKIFKESFDLFKSSIEKNKLTLEKYKKEAEKLRPEAEEKISKELIVGQLNKDYRVSDIKILMNGEWAVAKVQPLSFQTDDAYIALQYLNSVWRAIAGPGTSFSKEDYPNMPDEVLKALNGGI